MLEREKLKNTKSNPSSTLSSEHTPVMTEITSDFALAIENPVKQTSSSSASLRYETQYFDLPKLPTAFIKKFKIDPADLYFIAWGVLLKLFSGRTQITLFNLSNTQKSQPDIIKTFEFDFDFRKHTLKTIMNKTSKNHYHACSFEKTKPDYLFFYNKKQRKNFSCPHKFSVFIQKNNQACFSYQKKYFKTNNIKTLIEYFQHIVLQLTNNPDVIFSEIDWIIDREKTKLFGGWSQIDFNFKKSQDYLVYDAFVKSAQLYPDHIALTSENKKVTYAELNAEINSIAAYLLQKPIRQGDRVAVLLDRTPQLFAVMLAIFKIGAIYVPLNPKLPSERLSYIMKDSQAVCMITQNHSLTVDLLPTEYIWLLPPRWQDIPNIAPENWILSTPLVSSDDPAYILYTSGTTGTPKGVIIHHKNISNLIHWYHFGLNINKNDRASQFASQGFDTSLCESLPFLACGATVSIVEDHIKLSPPLFFNWLKEFEITICDLPTAYAQTLFALKWPSLPNLRLVKIGGESLNHYPEQVFSFDIWNTYGPTETTIETTYVKLCSANTIYKNKNEVPPIGKPIPNMEVFIVNEELQLLPIGVSGELLIGGKGLSSGYWNLPERTAERFIPHLWKKSNEKLYRSGDIVKFRADGQLEFIGRKDHQVKIRGYRIELSDIAATTSQFSDVGEVTVIAKENHQGEKTLIAYVVPNLNKERFPFQERCLLTLKNNMMLEAISDNISKEGLGLCGITTNLEIGSRVQVQLKLPGMTTSSKLIAHIVWQRDDRCGLLFLDENQQRTILSKSIEYLLSTQNIKELLLTTAAKRNLRIALKKKLPEYMIPSQVMMLTHFPLNFNGKIDVKALPEPDYSPIPKINNTTPPQTTTEKIIAELACQILKIDSMNVDDHFFEMGGTSIKAAEWLVRIHEKFGITIPPKLLIDFPFVSVLSNYIDKKGDIPQTQQQTHLHILQDAELDAFIEPQKESTKIKAPKNILLTGAGGFLGVFLLHSLLKKSDAKIYCIIRRGEFETAAKRLLTVINQFKLNNLISLNDRRIVIIAGDLSLDHFGLPEDHYQMLKEKIDMIIHCGAQVNTMASYNALRDSNVLGTKRILQLATEHHNKPVHYISTLSSAYMKNDKGEYAEIFPDQHFEQLTGGYPISKWVSERLIAQVLNRGLNSAIYRLGYIGGDSKQGIANLNDALLILIKGCIQMGFAPKWNEVIDLLPVDFVADTIIDFSLNENREESVFHINHPTGIVWTDLVNWLNEYGYKIKLLKMKKWQEKLTDLNPNHPLYPFIPTLLHLQESGSPKASLIHTKKFLKKLKKQFPKLDSHQLKTYMAFLHRTGFIEPQKK